MNEPFSSQFATPSESPGFLLWQVTNAWQRRLRGVLKAVDLTHVQFVLLAVLSWMEQQQAPVTQVQLAQRSYIDVMMTSQVLRTLEGKGLVMRLDHPSDTRAKSIKITASGSALVAQAIVLVEGADQAFFSALDEVPAFTGALRRLLDSDQAGSA
jgi:DNA-binding MarR family transcriptional regulator